jgi:hypothetical protein
MDDIMLASLSLSSLPTIGSEEREHVAAVASTLASVRVSQVEFVSSLFLRVFFLLKKARVSGDRDVLSSS